jgi:putative component of toxin-antitoxin plasmid stabilization module|tara:strand:- start:387 stop:809 length:423 start_codon:yes stop_codon:yes gene_type:complete
LDFDGRKISGKIAAPAETHIKTKACKRPMFAVFRTAEFDRELKKNTSKSEQSRIGRLERLQLTKNPFVGDPLGITFLREKRIDGKRAYFLVYEDIRCVLMVGLSDKKAQQETIDRIRSNLVEYYAIVKEAIKQHGEFGRA